VGKERKREEGNAQKEMGRKSKVRREARRQQQSTSARRQAVERATEAGNGGEAKPGSAETRNDSGRLLGVVI
jgi:hypothetical protein